MKRREGGMYISHMNSQRENVSEPGFLPERKRRKNQTLINLLEQPKHVIFFQYKYYTMNIFFLLEA